jgi:hypothetical protein
MIAWKCNLHGILACEHIMSQAPLGEIDPKIMFH